jgi:hypothetical protein
LLGGVNDKIGVLGWMSLEEDDRKAGALLGARSDLESERVEIYVCPECGDIGCGAVTAVVEVHGHRVIWRDFGLERDWEDSHAGRLDLKPCRGVGPFRFKWPQYRDAITERARS